MNIDAMFRSYCTNACFFNEYMCVSENLTEKKIDELVYVIALGITTFSITLILNILLIGK
jgi:hypothetical protein